jgi:hypothetical protein
MVEVLTMKQNTTPNPEARLFEAYMSYAGGHNSEISNERLKDDEFPVMENVDLSGRDSAKRRTGRVKMTTLPATCQGHFLYYKVGGTTPDHIFASNGRIYYYQYTTGESINIQITDNGTPWTFQTTKMVEAVQYGTVLYIATGTKLVEFTYESGYFNAKTVVPYTPTVQEVVYIGTNALAPNPAGYVQDSVTTNITVSGIAPYYRSGAVNMPLPFTAYVGKPSTIASLDYKWEYRITNSNVSDGVAEVFTINVLTGATTTGNILFTIGGQTIGVNFLSGDTTTVAAARIRGAFFNGWTSGGTGSTVTFTCNTVGVQPDAYYSVSTPFTGITLTTSTIQGVAGWTIGRNWTNETAGGKTFDMNVSSVATYDIRVTVRNSAVPATTEVKGSITGYRIEGTLNKENNTQDMSGIQTCTYIRLHWDRLLLYGDTKNPFLMYISDLKNPRYIPTTNVLSFDTGKLEPVTSVVRFQDYLVIMTPTTIQTLIGKDPTTYARYLIHDSIGSIAPRAASVVGNQIMFLSYNGITSLRPNPYRIEVMNVKRTDVQIHNEIYTKMIATSYPDTDACSMFHDNQYWICFPATKTIYRFYHELGVWVRDKSSILTIKQFLTHGGKAYNLTNSPDIYRQDDTVWADGTDVYTMELDSKMYDLGYSFNFKKMRRMYILARHFKTNTNLYVRVYADSAVILTPEDGKAVVLNDGADTQWQVTTEPNIHFYAGTIVGSWVLGKNPLGDIQISVQKASIQGKCRRVKVNIQHKENAPCEIFGVGFEHKLKKV